MDLISLRWRGKKWVLLTTTLKLDRDDISLSSHHRTLVDPLRDFGLILQRWLGKCSLAISPCSDVDHLVSVNEKA